MANNRQVNNVPIRHQSGLSRGQVFQAAGVTENDNRLFLATVVSVDYSQNRIQYLPYDTNNATKSTKFINNYTALLPTNMYGLNQDGLVYGQVYPVQIGNTVLLGNVKGKAGQVIVIGVYPSLTDNRIKELNTFDTTSQNLSNSEWQDTLWQQKVIYPSQQVSYISGDGALIRTLDGDTFLSIGNDPIGKGANLLDDPWSEGDLLYNDYKNYVIKSSETEAPSVVFMHQSNTDGTEDDTHITKFYLTPEGNFSIRKYDNTLIGKESLLSVDTDDGINLITRDRIDNSVDGGAATNYLNLAISSKDNIFKVTKGFSGRTHNISLDSEGFKVDDTLVVTEGSFSELSTQVQEAQDTLTDINNTFDAMGGQDFLTSIPIKLSDLNKAVGTNTLAIKANKDELEVINGTNGTLPTLITKFNDLTSPTGAIANVDSKVNTINNTTIPQLQKSIDTNNTNANQKISDMQTTIDSLTTENDTLKTALQALTDRVTALESK